MNPKSRKHGKSKMQTPHHEHLSRILALIIRTCESNSGVELLSCPLGLARNKDVEGLYNWADSVGTVVYPTAAQHFAANQVAALILKYPWPAGMIGRPDPEATALLKFNAAEERCRKTNRRLRRSVSRYDRYIDQAARWIENVIGLEPDVPEILQKCFFSSGANIGVHGNATNLFRKLRADWTVTPTAVDYLSPLILRNFQFFELLCKKKGPYRCYDTDAVNQRVKDKVRVTHYNKVSFVPKNAKTHRAIAIEPVGNSIIQKGIDLVLRSKLKTFGIDLTNQERNAYLAKVGSSDGSLSTLDLSSASDTVSIAVVKRLLPPAWFRLLDNTRSPSHKTKTQPPKRYEKFVSMGNGFCFPLESLIFGSLIKAVIQIDDLSQTFGVYGDDLIIDARGFDKLRRVLTYCGFQLNVEKSFWEGPFRESCGADWYEGQDVRPVVVDETLMSASSLMIIHNSTLRSQRCRDFFSEVRPWLRSLVEKPLLRPEQFRYSRPLDPLRGLDKRTVRLSHGEALTIQPEMFSMKLDKLALVNANGAFSVEMDCFMGSNCAKWDRSTQRWSWKEYRFVPVPDHDDSELFQESRYLAKIQSSGSELNLRYTTRRVLVKV